MWLAVAVLVSGSELVDIRPDFISSKTALLIKLKSGCSRFNTN